MVARRNSLLGAHTDVHVDAEIIFVRALISLCQLCQSALLLLAVAIAIDTFSIILLHPEIAAFCSREIRTGIRVPGWSK